MHWAGGHLRELQGSVECRIQSVSWVGVRVLESGGGHTRWYMCAGR